MVFGNTEVNIPCPGCKREFSVKLRQIEDKKVITCPHCKKRIELNVKGDDLKAPDRELEKLKKTIKDIGDIDINIQL